MNNGVGYVGVFVSDLAGPRLNLIQASCALFSIQTEIHKSISKRRAS